jgi:hypothetical protein
VVDSQSQKAIIVWGKIHLMSEGNTDLKSHLIF